MLENKHVISVKLIAFFIFLTALASCFLGIHLHSSLFDYTCFAISTIFAILLTNAFYIIFYRPLNRLVDDQFGYYTDPGRSRKHQIDQIRRLRWLGDPPPAFANGWYPVIECHRLKTGEAQTINMVGLVLAIFRDTGGTAHVIDAYCPHLGANLGAGGRVVDDCLECPFHAWRFRGHDGRCVHVPALKEGEKIPDKARVKSYNVHEVNGWIHFWFDAEDREPSWKIPEIEDISSGELTFRGRTEHIVYSHMEDLPENGADMAHLSVVHNPSLLAGHDLRFFRTDQKSITNHDFTGSWEPAPPPNNHMAIMKVQQCFKALGMVVPGSDIEVHIEQIGPAVVYLNFKTIMGRVVISHVVIPAEPMVQRLVHGIFAQRSIPTIIAKAFLLGMTKQVDRDMIIWNNKFYTRQPLLMKTPEDSTIQKHRRWFRQFYSENSPKVQARSADGMDW